jgi:hypothetical protein
MLWFKRKPNFPIFTKSKRCALGVKQFNTSQLAKFSEKGVVSAQLLSTLPFKKGGNTDFTKKSSTLGSRGLLVRRQKKNQDYKLYYGPMPDGSGENN